MKPIDEAILVLEQEIEKNAQAKAGSTYWLVRQATAAGLSLLTKAKQLGIESPEAIDRFRKQVRTDALKLEEAEVGVVVTNVSTEAVTLDD